MAGRINYSGLVIAGIGFFTTRFTVTLAVYDSPLRFYLAGVVPLCLGLGLAAFGVALTVADLDRSFVRTTAAWTAVGTLTMLGLAGLTLLGSTTGSLPNMDAIRSQAYLANFLIGGSVGGTLTGLYAARSRRQRAALDRQADRLAVLNRLLRHEILNALTVIRGYAAHGETESDEGRERVVERADDIEATIGEVRFLTRSAREQLGHRGDVELGPALSDAVGELRAEHPEAEFDLADAGDLEIVATDRVRELFAHLLEHAVLTGGDDPTVRIEIDATSEAVSVTVDHDGAVFTDRQRRLLESGDVGEFDDPETGFGLNVARLLAESYDADVRTDGAAVTVSLPRAASGVSGLQTSRGLIGVRPEFAHLVVTLAAALLAGAAYGGVSELLGRPIAGIGVFYGEPDPVVGWITHQFHSVVFGFVFAGIVAVAPARLTDRPGGYVGLGTGWGLTLWLVAASVVAPVWLRLLGIPASLPTLSGDLFWMHLAWGLSLGVLTGLGYEYVIPALERRWE